VARELCGLILLVDADELERRFSTGLYFLGNWTWSHSLDNFGGDGGASGPTPPNLRNRGADWASSNSGTRHRVNLASTYLLLFGRGRSFANTGQIIGGWEVGGIAVMQSGLPFTVTVPGSPSNTGAGSRANPIAGVNPYPANRSIWEGTLKRTRTLQFRFLDRKEVSLL
jgi:hypothetical protein